jgi:hypothetical protein
MDTGSWQPDPTHRHELRWWTGTQWSDQVADHGVPAHDPLHAMAPPSLTPAPPAPTQMMWAAATPLPSSGARAGGRRPLLIVGGAVGLVAVVAGVTFALTNGDDGTSVGAATSVSTTVATTTAATAAPTVTVGTVAPTTAVPASVAPTTVPAPTTAPARSDLEILLAALPADSDVPADWSRYSDASTDLTPASGAGYGFCGGDNSVARAIDHGSEAFADGPTWDLPGGGWFGITVYSFPSAEEAAGYLADTDLAANGCMTAPVQYDTTEGDLDLFDETVADDTPWHIAEGTLAIREATIDADELLRTVEDSYASATVDGYDYSVTMTYLTRNERHGRVVIQFWLYGSWNHQGWDEAPPWAFQPDDAAVDAAAAVVRPVLLERLRAGGAL